MNNSNKKQNLKKNGTCFLRYNIDISLFKYNILLWKKETKINTLLE